MVITWTHIKELNDKIERYESALREIEKFGHGVGHGRGYTCANMAKKVLDEFGA